MAVFSKKVLRLLSDELTETVLREIDALFENNDIALGHPQPDDNDESVCRERMRRYLSTLNLSDPSDVAKLARVYSDLMHEIAGRGVDFYRDKWLRILRFDGFHVDESTWEVSAFGSFEHCNHGGGAQRHNGSRRHPRPSRSLGGPDQL